MMHRHSLLTVFALLVLIAGAHNATAQTVAPQACDPGYWQSMKERAWLEAEREIMQNQNLIFKPDSVLEYTCFDKMLNHASKNLGDIFVHTQYFGQLIIPRNEEKPEAQGIGLKNAVYNAMKAYIDSNFNEAGNIPDFLDSRVEFLRKRPDKRDHDGDDLQETTAEGSNYSGCNVMSQIWMASKCMNFIDRQDYTQDESQSDLFNTSDGFHPFVTLEPGPNSKVPAIAGYNENPDRRLWGTPCGNIRGEEWQRMYNLANNEGEDGEESRYVFQTKVEETFQDVRTMVEPGECSPPINTGVMVVLSGGNPAGGGNAARPNPDAFCTNPGCTYDSYARRCE